MNIIELTLPFRVIYTEDNIIRVILKNIDAPTQIADNMLYAEFDNENELDQFMENNNLKEVTDNGFTTENNE